MSFFYTDHDDEQYNRLITQIKQRVSMGQSRREIFEDLLGLYGEGIADILFLAYHSALILIKHETEGD